jgi:hypothetical protein
MIPVYARATLASPVLDGSEIEIEVAVDDMFMNAVCHVYQLNDDGDTTPRWERSHFLRTSRAVALGKRECVTAFHQMYETAILKIQETEPWYRVDETNAVKLQELVYSVISAFEY